MDSTCVVLLSGMGGFVLLICGACKYLFNLYRAEVERSRDDAKQSLAMLEELYDSKVE